MINKPVEIMKQYPKSSISIGTVVALLGLFGGFFTFMDTYFAHASDIEQYIQRDIEKEQQRLRDELVIIELKEQEGVATKYEIVRKQQILRDIQR